MDVPGTTAIGYWPAGFYLGAAALCYFLGASGDLTVPLFSLGALTALAKYVMRNES